MADDTPDPARLLKLARQALTSAEFRKKFHLVDFYGPNEFYEPQLKFFAEGATHHQRLLRGGNQVGKSFACAFEGGLHSSCAMAHNVSCVAGKASLAPAPFRLRRLPESR